MKSMKNTAVGFHSCFPALMAGMLLLLICPAAAQTPKLDSLKTALPLVKEDTGRVNTLNLISRELFITGKYDSSQVCAQNAKELGEKAAFPKGVSNAYNNIGNIFLSKGDRDKALENYNLSLKALAGLRMDNEAKKLYGNSYSNIGNVYVGAANYDSAAENYNRALKLRLEADDKKGIAICYSNFGVIAYYKGNYPEALKNYFQALKLDKERGDKNAIARSHNNIGNIYIQQESYAEALNNYMEALKIQQETGDKQGMGRAYNNIGAVHVFRKEYDEAEKAFSEGLKIKEEIGDKYGIGHAYINLGIVGYTRSQLPGVSEKEKQEKAQAALPYFGKALEVLESIGDKQGMAMCYNNFGAIHVVLHKGAEGLLELKKGLALAREVASKEDIKSSYRGLASADSSVGNWKEAYNDHLLFIAYRDSLQNDENTKKLVQAQMNFDFEQKEALAKAEQDKKDAILMAELQQHRIISWSVAGVSVLLILFIILLFNRNRLKQKNAFQQKLNQQQKEQAIAIMETQEQERKRIAEDLHDSLGHLLSTVKLNLQTLPDDQRHHYVNSLQLLNQASKEIHDISFNLMPQTLEEEGLIPALHELAQKIRRSDLYDIILQVHDMENFALDKQTKFNIYRIVQEAVNNILKHASAKEINIQLIRHEDLLTIMVEDDGKGFNTEEMKRNGRGLRNITARAEWLHGNIQIDSAPGRGTTISIEIPIKDGN
jgi:signal transduction histidine kinase/tetratricopeptide (TPR) repeat protein